MKKFLLSIFALMLTAFSLQAQSTATLTFDDIAKRTEFDTNHQVWVENGITVTNNKSASTTNVANYSKPVRFYQNSSIIVECKSMTQIVFDCNNSTHATALKNSIGSAATVSSDKVTVSLSSAEDSFTVEKLTAQVRLDAVTVSYIEDASAVALYAPEASVASGVYKTAQSVTFESKYTNAENPTIDYYYTTDGSTPTKESTKVEDAVEVTENCTIKVIAVMTVGEEEYVSSVATYEYIISAAIKYVVATNAEQIVAGKVLIAANNKAMHGLDANASYGELPAHDVVVIDGTVEDVVYYSFELEAAEGGWYIKDNAGRYIYMSGTYNNFNVSKTVPTSAGIWTINIAEDGTATIKNVEKNKYIQYLKKGLFASYDTTQSGAVLPKLYIPYVEPVKLAVVSQTPAADEVVESFNSITIEFNKDIEFIQAAGGTNGTDATGGTNGTDATGGTNGTDATGGTNGTDATGGTNGTSGPAQFIKLKDANGGVAATAWVSAATIDGNKVTFVFEMNAAISKTGTYSFAIPAGLIKATDGEEFAGQTFTFEVEEPVKLAVVSQTPAADEVVESFNSITIEFNKDIEFIQAAGGTNGTDATGGTNGTDATGGTNGTDATGGTNGTSGPAQFIKLKDANGGVAATAWVSAATIDGNKVTFVFEMNAAISKTGTYSFAIPAGLIKATDGEEFAGQTFTFQVEEPVKLAVVSQTPAADEVVESFNSITIEFNKDIEFIQAAGGTNGTDATGGTNGTDATGGTNGTDATGGTNGTDATGGTNGTSGPAQFIKLKDANGGVAATAWVSAATIDGNKVTFVFEMNAAITKTGTYSFAIPAGLIKATDGEEFAGQTFTFEVDETLAIEDVETENENNVIYDLSGRRIVEITKSGIYIVNGKKIYVK